MKTLLSLVAGALLAVSTSAQCSDLTVSGSGAAGGTLTFAVTGAQADAPLFLASGQDAGSTTLTFGPIGSLTLGLASPFVLLPIGFTDENGDGSLDLMVPNVPNLPSVTLNAQAFSADIEFASGSLPTLTFCESDVESFAVGS